jgi:hypothetical protein
VHHDQVVIVTEAREHLTHLRGEHEVGELLADAREVVPGLGRDPPAETAQLAVAHGAHAGDHGRLRARGEHRRAHVEAAAALLPLLPHDEVDGIVGPPHARRQYGRDPRLGQGQLVEGDLHVLAEGRAREPVQLLLQQNVAIGVQLADDEAPEVVVPIGVAEAADEPGEQVPQPAGRRFAGPAPDRHRRELLDPRVDERPDRVLGRDLQHLVVEPVERTEADEGDEIGGDRVAAGRQHEDLADLRREHPSPA